MHRRIITVSCLAVWSFGVGACDNQVTTPEEMPTPAFYEDNEALTENEWASVLENAGLSADVFVDPMGGGSFPQYIGVVNAVTEAGSSSSLAMAIVSAVTATAKHAVYAGWANDMRTGDGAGSTSFSDAKTAFRTARLEGRYEVPQLNCAATPFGGLSAHSYNDGSLKALVHRPPDASGNVQEPAVNEYSFPQIRRPETGVAGPALCNAPPTCPEEMEQVDDYGYVCEKAIEAEGSGGDGGGDGHDELWCVTITYERYEWDYGQQKYYMAYWWEDQECYYN